MILILVRIFFSGEFLHVDSQVALICVKAPCLGTSQPHWHVKYRYYAWLLTFQLLSNENPAYIFSSLKLYCICTALQNRKQNAIWKITSNWTDFHQFSQITLPKLFSCDALLRSESISIQVLGFFGDFLAVHNYRTQVGTIQLGVRGFDCISLRFLSKAPANGNNDALNGVKSICHWIVVSHERYIYLQLCM